MPPCDSHAGIVANKKRIAIPILIPRREEAGGATGLRDPLGDFTEVVVVRSPYTANLADGWASVRDSEGVPEADGEDREEGSVAQVVVVACDEGCEVFLECRILADRLASDRCGEGRVAGAADEVDLQVGLTDVVETDLDWDAEAVSGARKDVSEAEREAGRDSAEVDASVAVQRVGEAADVVVAIEAYGAAGGDESGCEDSIVIGEDEQRAETETAAEGEPVERGAAGFHAEVDGYVGALLLEGGGVGEEVGACAEVEFSGQRCGNVKTCAGESCVRVEAYGGKGVEGFGIDDGGWGTGYERCGSGGCIGLGAGTGIEGAHGLGGEACCDGFGVGQVLCEHVRD